MSFPSSSGTVQDNLALAWASAREIASFLKSRAQVARTATDGNVAASDVIGYAQTLAEAKTKLARYASTPGILAYARAQINNPTFDLVAEYNAMISSVDAVTAWIITNFPKDGSGNLLAAKFDVDGRIVYNVFSSAQLAGLKPLLDNLIAAIN